MFFFETNARGHVIRERFVSVAADEGTERGYWERVRVVDEHDTAPVHVTRRRGARRRPSLCSLCASSTRVLHSDRMHAKLVRRARRRAWRDREYFAALTERTVAAYVMGTGR